MQGQWDCPIFFFFWAGGVTPIIEERVKLQTLNFVRTFIGRIGTTTH